MNRYNSINGEDGMVMVESGFKLVCQNGLLKVNSSTNECN